MKRHLLTLCVFMLCFYTYAQNNVYGKYVKAIDSLAVGSNVTSDGGSLTVDGLLIDGTTIEDTSATGGFNLRSNGSLTLDFDYSGGGEVGDVFRIRDAGVTILDFTNNNNYWDFEGNGVQGIGYIRLEGAGENIRIVDDSNNSNYVRWLNVAGDSLQVVGTNVSKIYYQNLGLTNLDFVNTDSLYVSGNSNLVGTLDVGNLTFDGDDITSTSELGINTSNSVDVNIGGSSKFLFDVSDEDLVIGGSARYGEFDFTAPVNYSINTGGNLTLNSDDLYLDYNDDNDGSDLFIRSNNSNVVSINSTGNAEFSGAVQSQTLNVFGGSTTSAIIGSDFDDNSTLTDATNKLGRIATPHYTNAEESIAQLYGRSDATSNQVNIGGGTSLMNAATEISFYTASNTTTTTGTNRLTIDSSGKATFAGDMTFSDYGSGSNTGTAAYSLAVDASGNVIEEGLAITTNEQSTTTSATSYAPTFTINLQRLYQCSISIYESNTEYFSNFYMVYGRPSGGVTSTSMHGKQGAGTNGSVTPTFGVSGTTLTVTLSSMTSASKEIVVRITEL